MCQHLLAVWTAEADNEKQPLTKRFQINLQIWAHLGEGSEKVNGTITVAIRADVNG